MVFAHLVHTQMEAVLEFLSSVPGPTGKPALEFVLTEWCSKQHLFYGAYEGKVRSVKRLIIFIKYVYINIRKDHMKWILLISLIIRVKEKQTMPLGLYREKCPFYYT